MISEEKGLKLERGIIKSSRYMKAQCTCIHMFLCMYIHTFYIFLCLKYALARIHVRAAVVRSVSFG